MAYNEQTLLSTVTGVCITTSLATSQYCAVTYTNSGGDARNMVISTAATACTGILQDNPVVGQAGAIQVTGITKVAIKASSAAITAGDLLEVSDDGYGTLMAHSSGSVVAQALESITPGTTRGVISALLMPSADALA